ncbi:MAG: FAD-binding oxidoreductase [Phycisphaerales bacterium]|nr:FAD-binding oxidoreductase [Phycisphaerales bacterium]
MLATTLTVNDIHSSLNETTVRQILRPSTVAEVCDIVRCCAAERRSLSICGSRHAMGGQQFLAGETLIDMRLLNRIVALDHDRGLITAEAGIEWPELIAGYLEMQREREPSREPRWGIAQKQTGADTLTLGGALSANAHGRGLTMPPIVHDVESFMLVTARGELITCSRTDHAELFALAIGGYGLFGVIVAVTLRLCERRPMRRVVRVIDIDDAVNAARRRIDAGFIYGDFQFDIDPNSAGFLTKGVFSCYEPAPGARPPVAPARELAAQDWEQLLLLAHTDKARAFAL